MISVGQIPEGFSTTDVYELTLAELPTALVGRRALYTELIWDAEGGFQQEWIDGSSVEVHGDDTVTFLLKRRAFSAAGLSLFVVGAGGGGTSELDGNVTGPSDANVVVAIQNIPVVLDGAPGVGDVLTYREPGGDPRLVFEEPAETGDATSIQGEPVPPPSLGVLTFDGTDLSWEIAAGPGDVVGPASAVADRVATYNGTTGKIIKDGGKTIAGIEASAVATANTYTDAHGTWHTGLNDDYTVMANQVMVNGANVINGRTWTGVDIGTYSTLFEIQNGLGVQMKANAVSTGMYNTFRTMAHLKIKLVDFCPGIHLKSRIRVTAVMETTGEAAGAEVTQVALGSWTHHATNVSMLRLVVGYITAANQNRIDGWRTSTYVDSDNTTQPVGNRQGQFQLDSIPEWQGHFYSSPYTLATPVVWNDPKTFVETRGFDFLERWRRSFSPTGDGFMDTTWLKAPCQTNIDELCVMFSVSTGNTNNNTSLLGSLKALRIEYTK